MKFHWYPSKCTQLRCIKFVIKFHAPSDEYYTLNMAGLVKLILIQACQIVNDTCVFATFYQVIDFVYYDQSILPILSQILQEVAQHFFCTKPLSWELWSNPLKQVPIYCKFVASLQLHVNVYTL